MMTERKSTPRVGRWKSTYWLCTDCPTGYDRNMAHWTECPDCGCKRPSLPATPAPSSSEIPNNSSETPAPSANAMQVCICGHTAAQHIYHIGGCRPGFACPRGCEKFTPPSPRFLTDAQVVGKEPIAGVDDADSIRLRSLHVDAEAGKPWSARAGFDGPAVELFASALCNFYRENGGENYVELYLRDPASPHEEFVVTVQRKAGKTPHELRKAAEAELAALRAVPVEGASLSSRVRGLLEAIATNDPDDMAADGVTVGAVWQQEAKALLAAPLYAHAERGASTESKS